MTDFAELLAADALAAAEGERSEACTFIPLAGPSVPLRAVVRRGMAIGRDKDLDPEFAKGLGDFAVAVIAASRLEGVAVEQEAKLLDAKGVERSVRQWRFFGGYVRLYLAGDVRAAL